MTNPFFDHPILNSPYEYPARYWELDDQGQPTQRPIESRRRAEFTRALGAYLDWVSLQMSGRAAAEQALPDAARIGDGWPLQLIRATVTHAARAGIDPWTALAQLGERIGVGD